MGSRTYDFLNDSFLFDSQCVQDQFRGISDDDVHKELRRYREFCLSITPELEQEILLDKSNLKLFAGIRHVDIALLKQSAFYVHQHVLYDPLFVLTETTTDQSRTMNEFLGMKPLSLGRPQLTHTVAYMKALMPMVATDYVKFLPTSYFFEPPKELPITYSTQGFAERIPEALHDFFHSKAVVESGKKVDGGIQFDGSFTKGRIILIRFEGHGFEETYSYTLTAQETVNVKKEDRTAEFRMTLPDRPPDEKTFDAWVHQSIHQAAGGIYQRVLVENIFSARFGAAYFTKSPFLFELLEQIIPVEHTIQTDTTNG